MHELAIACELVELAQGAARRAGAAQVVTVYLKLGALSGVVEEALRFGYQTAAAGTLLEGARLEIEQVPVILICPDCGQRSQPPSIQALMCPVCGGLSPHIIQGKEIELTSLEVAEHANAPA